jgi:hypothetical protein
MWASTRTVTKEDRQTDRQTERDRFTETDRQTDRQTYRDRQKLFWTINMLNNHSLKISQQLKREQMKNHRKTIPINNPKQPSPAKF